MSLHVLASMCIRSWATSSPYFNKQAGNTSCRVPTTSLSSDTNYTRQQAKTCQERKCTYPTPSLLASASTVESQSQELSPPLSEVNTSSDIDIPNIVTVPKIDLPLQDPTLAAAINLDHTKFLIHLTFDGSIFSLANKVTSYRTAISIALNSGLEFPFLLHQLLAYSARHLAYLHPQNSASYLHQAVALQTRAISLFNDAWAQVNRTVDKFNCVPVILFASTLGHHVLADTLIKRESTLDAFIEHYIQCLITHRGMYDIAHAAWPFLLESELEPIMTWSSSFTSRSPCGYQCQPLHEMIKISSGLSETAKEICREQIDYLQVGLDAILSETSDSMGNRYQMLFSWTMLAPPEFRDLLEAKRPEVLVLLGYYALMLYYGRHMWQVGNAGVYILELVSDYLSPDWQHWLDFARQSMAIDLNN